MHDARRGPPATRASAGIVGPRQPDGSEQLVGGRRGGRAPPADRAAAWWAVGGAPPPAGRASPPGPNPFDPAPAAASSTGSPRPVGVALPSIAPTPYGTHFDGSLRRCASVVPRSWSSS